VASEGEKKKGDRCRGQGKRVEEEGAAGEKKKRGGARPAFSRKSEKPDLINEWRAARREEKREKERKEGCRLAFFLRKRFSRRRSENEYLAREKGKKGKVKVHLSALLTLESRKSHPGNCS